MFPFPGAGYPPVASVSNLTFLFLFASQGNHIFQRIIQKIAKYDHKICGTLPCCALGA